MSREHLEHLDPQSIYDEAARTDVLRLKEDFADESLETCYYWYLYDHCEYETTKARFTNGLSEPFQSATTIFPTAQILGIKSINLGVFPAEIWQIISTHLAHDDLSKLRLTSSALADIAAESLVEKIRFDLSFESLERLRSIAAHEHLRIGVRFLTFEAVLLAPLGCIHSYSAHYDLEHHQDVKPQPPPESQSTPQAQRLYARNLAKFEKALEEKYARYRKIFEAQERLLYGPKEHLFECIDKFPNLHGITLATDQCRHLLSERFIQRYVQDCAVPLVIDHSETPWELQNLLRPGIKQLTARQISVKCFDGEGGRPKKWLESVFHNLEDLSLCIRHDRESQTISSMLESTNLSYAISCAKALKRLNVGFTTTLPVGQLSDIMPVGQSFSRLSSLNIESFIATEEEVITMLELQPALESLEFSDVRLSTGRWRNLLKRMRVGLDLSTFWVSGILQDATVELFTEQCSIGAWHDDEELSLAAAIDSYVTDSAISQDIDDEDDDGESGWNPVDRVEDGEFAPYDELRETLGPLPDDLDYFEEALSDDLEEDLPDLDDPDDLDDLPDLADLDGNVDNSDDDEDINDNSDDESVHTANEVISEHGDDSNQAMDDTGDVDDILPAPMDVD